MLVSLNPESISDVVKELYEDLRLRDPKIIRWLCHVADVYFWDAYLTTHYDFYKYERNLPTGGYDSCFIGAVDPVIKKWSVARGDSYNREIKGKVVFPFTLEKLFRNFELTDDKEICKGLK